MAARNSSFHSRDPLHHHSSLHLRHTTGPFHFLNPTRARYVHARKLASPPSSPEPTPPASDAERPLPEHSTTEQPPSQASPRAHSAKAPHEQRADEVAFQWRSRDNRKGRHALIVRPSDSPNAPYIVPERTNSLRAIGRGILAMLTQYPYWDVSWLVGIIFTLGSMVWVINAFFVWLPLVQPSSEFPNEISVAGGWSAFVGATIFEIGSVLLMIEAVNENRAGCFGWALEHVVDNLEGGKTRLRARPEGCSHHHVNRKNFVGNGPAGGKELDDGQHETADGAAMEKGNAEADGELGKDPDTRANGSAKVNGTSGAKTRLDNDVTSADRRTWQWYPSWHDLTSHYIFELGFLACAFQMFGATVFWISGFTAIPQIAAMLPTQAALNEGYWVPQMVGGTGFIISSACFMLETQPAWYIPAPKVLGWHIGLWNLIGALGFTLCGALGPAYGNQGAQFEASLATFWGSWAFLIGSVVQWYESLDTHPVEEMGENSDKAG